VVVEQADLDSPDVLEEALTRNIREFVAGAGYFRKVSTPPVKLGEGYRLRFRFRRYQVVRKAHPGYFPGAFCTLTLWIWVGGPIYQDTLAFDADLEVQDAAGTSLVRLSEAVEDHANVSFYSTNYAVAPSGTAERTEVIKRLLDRAVTQLQSDGGKVR